MVERRAAEAVAAVSFSSLASCCSDSMVKFVVDAALRLAEGEEGEEKGTWVPICSMAPLRGDKHGEMSGGWPSMSWSVTASLQEEGDMDMDCEGEVERQGEEGDHSATVGMDTFKGAEVVGWLAWSTMLWYSASDMKP